MRETIRQADAIFALEGFEKTKQSRKIDEAVFSRQQYQNSNGTFENKPGIQKAAELKLFEYDLTT
ncbi:MAG: hypothetical protein Q3966_06870 [Neisseria sp.]|nr:hypothetical protein [Neisseria sp.]